MVNLITGEKGTGKSKKLMELATKAEENSKGLVVVVEEGKSFKFDFSHKIRLIDSNEYNLKGYDMLYGFLSGISAGNYDVTDILVDNTLTICNDDINKLENFVKALNKLSESADINFTLSVSKNIKNLPQSLLDITKAE